MAVTINDVARHAGVSHTTVSWVIHDDPRITAETKEKVWKSIQALDYHPNILARSLVRGRTNVIAIVTAFFSTTFEISFLKGVEQAFDDDQDEFSITLYSTKAKPERRQKILKEILFGKRADAVILLNLPVEPETCTAFEKAGIPLIVVEQEAEGAHVIKMDNQQGAYDAVSFLAGKGRHNIGLVNGSTQDPESGLSPAERFAGYQRALEHKGLAYNPQLVYELDDYYFEEGERALDALVARVPSLDAVFCAAGDTVALGIMKAALARGISIPGDLAVVGYDNIEVASMVNPPLTSVSQSIEELGQAAIETVLSSLHSGEPEQSAPVSPANPEGFLRKVLQPRLVRRGSA